MELPTKDRKNLTSILANSRRAREGYLRAFTRVRPGDGRGPRSIAAFDMETIDGTLLGTIAGVAMTSDNDYPQIRRFSSTLDFIKAFCRDQYRSFVAYAHKGMSFDIAHLLSSEDVQKYLLENKFIVVVDRSFAIIRKSRHTWFLADSLRVFPERLENVLASFVPHRTKAPLPNVTFSWEHAGWRARIEEDTLGLYEALKRIEKIVWDTFKVPLSITMPSTALRAARTMIPVERITRPPRIALDWIRAGGYSGGRIEIFHQGEIRGNLYCFDINSAYAHAMKGEFPLGAGQYKTSEPKRGFFIGRCKLRVHTETHIPPVLSRLFNHAFCVGEFQAMLSKEEVEFARESGAQVEVLECWTWKDMAPIFRAFIERCQTLRRQDYFGPLGNTVKLMQNGLYGILGMNPFRKMQRMSIENPGKPWVHAFDNRHGMYIPNTFEALMLKETPTQMPHWAALITARVRIQLTRYLLLAEKLDMMPLYAHTDSIWLQSQNGIPKEFQNLISNDYGALKLEKRGNLAIVVAPGEAALKMNDETWHVASKGWRVKNEKGEDETWKVFEAGVETKISQVQTYRAGTAMKYRKVGHNVRKQVMSFDAMKNRLPAITLPGPTTPHVASAYNYEAYWSFRSWYLGKLFREPPFASRYLLTREPF